MFDIYIINKSDNNIYLIEVKMTITYLHKRNLIFSFLKTNIQMNKRNIVQHFEKIGFKRKYVYSIIKRYENGLPVERSMNEYSNKAKNKKKNLIKLKRITKNTKHKSYRKLGKKLNLHHKTVKKYLNELQIKRRCKKSIPKATLNQSKTQKYRIKKMVNELFKNKKCLKVLMDDESYFTFDSNQWGNKYYYDVGLTNHHENDIYIHKSKWQKKVLVWVTISQDGISKPVFLKPGSTLTSDVYIKKMIPKVTEFIEKYHKNDQIVFWPDLAPAHYSKKSETALKLAKINVVPKDFNPPNVPQLRPIENFWANLKRMVYSNNFQAKTVKQLIDRIKYCIKNIDQVSFQISMKKVPQKIRKAKKFGVNYFIK